MANRRDMSSRVFLPGQLKVYSESLRRGKNSPRTSPALKVQWGMRTGELVRWLGAPTWLLTTSVTPVPGNLLFWHQAHTDILMKARHPYSK